MSGYAQKNKEIIIAALGLFGVLATGVLSNLDKILPGRGVVKAEYAGYQPTGEFETELRYYLEISGTRKIVQSSIDTLLEALRAQLKAQHPTEGEDIDRFLSIAKEEQIRFDEIVDLVIPVYSRYFTVTEIQELNKFYSTRQMRDMTNKLPQIQKELAPLVTTVMMQTQQRVTRRLRELLQK